MKRISLNLNGADTVVGGPGPRAQQIIDFIKAIPNGKYFNYDGIAKSLKISRGAIDTRLRPYTDEIEGHMLLMPSDGSSGRKFVFGSKQGIATLKKQLQEAGLI